MTEFQDHTQVSKDLEHVCKRVRAKSKSYKKYNFSQHHNDFLKAFFDLAQEYDTLEDFYRICVAVPYEMINISSALYLCKGPEEGLFLVCSSERGVLKQPEPAKYPVQMSDTPYELGESYVIPIFSKQPFETGKLHGQKQEGEKRQTTLWNDIQGLCGQGHMLGMYEIKSPQGLSDSDKFFFTKYANRIGYNLDNRLIARQNIEHLKFINTLVVDIEHNIIVPNMYFKHLFNQLRKKIEELAPLKEEVERLSDEKNDQAEQTKECCRKLQLVQDRLYSYHQELVKHHSNTSLFLESLFRREHFEKGYLVLHPKRCRIEKEVIAPQLEHYSSRFKASKVTVAKPQNMMDEDFPIFVDIGLLAQVYANLFSNAAKYTKEIIDEHGNPRKAMAYGRELVNDFPGPGNKGIKFNVFTTGPSMTKEQGNNLFKEGTRGEGSERIPGTGHGLSFIRHVIEMHGGKVGYEPTAQGNNFYFILPLPPVDYPPVLANDQT